MWSNIDKINFISNVQLTTVPKDIKIEDISVTTDLSEDLKVASVNVDVQHAVGPAGKLDRFYVGHAGKLARFAA